MFCPITHECSPPKATSQLDSSPPVELPVALRRKWAPRWMDGHKDGWGRTCRTFGNGLQPSSDGLHPNSPVGVGLVGLFQRHGPSQCPSYPVDSSFPHICMSAAASLQINTNNTEKKLQPKESVAEYQKSQACCQQDPTDEMSRNHLSILLNGHTMSYPHA